MLLQIFSNNVFAKSITDDNSNTAISSPTYNKENDDNSVTTSQLENVNESSSYTQTAESDYSAEESVTSKALMLAITADPNIYGNIESFKNADQFKRKNDLYITLMLGATPTQVVIADGEPSGYNVFNMGGNFKESIDYVYRFDNPMFLRFGIASNQLIFSDSAFISFDAKLGVGYTFNTKYAFVSPYGNFNIGYTMQDFPNGMIISGVDIKGYGGGYFTIGGSVGVLVEIKDSIYSFDNAIGIVYNNFNSLIPGYFFDFVYRSNIIINPHNSPVAFLFGIAITTMYQPYQAQDPSYQYLFLTEVIDFGIRFKI